MRGLAYWLGFPVRLVLRLGLVCLISVYGGGLGIYGPWPCLHLRGRDPPKELRVVH